MTGRAVLHAGREWEDGGAPATVGLVMAPEGEGCKYLLCRPFRFREVTGEGDPLEVPARAGQSTPRQLR